MTTVAALFVDPKGVYSGLPGVEVWDESRDARTYAGPWPVVAHPPCARWSRLAGFTEARFGLKRGEDGGCFKAALATVREFGGVLEHPAYSDAWDAFELPKPSVRHGWTYGLHDAGASCYIEQGRYGLPVKKATWLYAVGVELPELRWGYTPDARGEQRNGHKGITAWADRIDQPRVLATWWHDGCARNKRLRATTPPEFRDVLLQMARSAGVRVAA